MGLDNLISKTPPKQVDIEGIVANPDSVKDDAFLSRLPTLYQQSIMLLAKQAHELEEIKSLTIKKTKSGAIKSVDNENLFVNISMLLVKTTEALTKQILIAFKNTVLNPEIKMREIEIQLAKTENELKQIGERIGDLDNTLYKEVKKRLDNFGSGVSEDDLG